MVPVVDHAQCVGRVGCDFGSLGGIGERNSRHHLIELLQRFPVRRAVLGLNRLRVVSNGHTNGAGAVAAISMLPSGLDDAVAIWRNGRYDHVSELANRG